MYFTGPAEEKIRSRFYIPTMLLLDCTEIFVQKLKCFCCCIRFYSQYKSNATVKFMTGVSPGGIITYISEPYGGRAFDKTIFEQSDLVLKLEDSRDAIMVDKGFLLVNELSNSLYNEIFFYNEIL